MSDTNITNDEVTEVVAALGMFEEVVPSAAPAARYIKELIVSGYQTNNPELVNLGRAKLNGVLEVFRGIRKIDNTMFDKAKAVGLDGWIREAGIQRLLKEVDPNTPRGRKSTKVDPMSLI